MSKNKPITSPKGVAAWPKLAEPDTKFSKEGTYSIKLRLSHADAEPFVAALKKAWEDYTTSDDFAGKLASVRKTKGKAFKPAPEFTREVMDDQGEPTGDVEFTFKAKASGTNKAGKPWKRGPIPVFDAKGRRVEVNVGGGSVVRVSAGLNPWLNPKGECGVSLQLEAVQVLELREWGNRAAGDYGFGEEEGYEGEEAPAKSSKSDGAEDEGSGEDADATAF